MLKRFTFLMILSAFVLSGQTTTTYDLSTAVPSLGSSGPMVCSDVQNCYFEIANGAQSGVFMSGGYWTQFDYRAFPGQNPGYNADYCAYGTPPGATWNIADTPALGPTAKLFTYDCHASDLHGVPSVLHAEIYAHSYVATYVCGGRVRTVCHQTRWAIDSGSA
jgi:hypothetical protein